MLDSDEPLPISISQKEVIKSLSSRCLFLQTMFKTLDLISFHRTKKEKAAMAFFKWRL